MMTLPDIKSKDSLVGKHLNTDRWRRLFSVKTETSGFTLAKAVEGAVKLDDLPCGIYAGDQDCYTDLSEVFEPIILEQHDLKFNFTYTSDFGSDTDENKIGSSLRAKDYYDAKIHSVR